MSHFPNAPSNDPNAGFASESAAMDESLSTWPRTIGIISLIYAILGLLCGVVAAANAFLEKTFLQKFANITIDKPQILMLRDGLLVACIFILGIVMICGSVSLLRRRSGGVKLLKAWAMLRMLLVVVGLAAGVATMKAQLQYEKDKQAAIEAANPGSAGKSPFGSGKNPLTDQQMWMIAIGVMALIAVIASIYPIIIMIFLSRRKITDEVAHWELPPAY